MKTIVKPYLAIIRVSLVLAAQLAPKAFGVVPPPDGGYPGGNTAEGQSALLSLTSGGYNTAVGFFSLRSNTTNSFNTAVGAGTLLFNTADLNTATGAAALLSNTTGSFNSANGSLALISNTTGSNNTASGSQALFSNQTGANNAAYGDGALYLNIASSNTALGSQTLGNNTEGSDNTAVGTFALLSNTTGSSNTGSGSYALFYNQNGADNAAYGYGALFQNLANGNSAFGSRALLNNDLGAANTAMGDNALHSNTTGSDNTAVGRSALSNNMTGSGIIALGANAGEAVTMVDHVICIGHPGADLNNSCFIGNIYGALIDPGTATNVGIDASGRLGTTTSSRRFKRDIKPMNDASEAIHSLKPVTFHYQNDSKDTPCFGLIAEEVAAVNPDLVVRNKEGNPFTVRYDQVNAMLLNEFLKEHQKVQEMEVTIGKLKGALLGQEANAAQQQKQIDTLTAGLQKVSAQLAAASPSRDGLELNKFATGRTRRGGSEPKTVLND